MDKYYIERMKSEFLELIEKTDALAKFMSTQIFEGLSVVEKFLLSEQFDAMVSYSRILEARISIVAEHDSVNLLLVQEIVDKRRAEDDIERKDQVINGNI